MKKTLNVLQLALGTLPIALVLCAHFFVQDIWLCGVFAALYTLLASLCLRVPGKKRVLAGLLCALALLAAGLWLMPLAQSWPSAALPVLYVILLFCTLPMGGWPETQELPLNASFVCMGGYMLLQLFQFTGMREVYGPVAPAMLGGFLGYLVLWLLMLNRSSLQSASAGKGRAPRMMQRRNTLLTLLFTAVILLIAAIPALAEALSRAWEHLKALIALIARWIGSLFPTMENAGGGTAGGGGPMELGLEAGEPSLLAQILEKVAVALAILIGIALAVWAGRILWRKLRVLMGKLWALLMRYTLAASEDYVDEVAATRGGGIDSQSTRRRAFRRRLRMVQEDRLSPAERIRYRYQRLLWKRTEWAQSSTARENLSAESAQLYEKARYSSAPVSAAEAEAFAQKARGLERNA